MTVHKSLQKHEKEIPTMIDENAEFIDMSSTTTFIDCRLEISDDKRSAWVMTGTPDYKSEDFTRTWSIVGSVDLKELRDKLNEILEN